MHWRNGYLRLLITALIFGIANSSPTALRTNSLVKRERVPDDATDWQKMFDWMIEVNVEDEKLVFYSSPRQEDAKKFTEANPDYFYFWDIFDSGFQEDFGDVDMKDGAVTKACSKAMAIYAKGETRVFGDKTGLKKNSQVTKIWSMKDSTTDPEDHPDGDLKASASEEPEYRQPAKTMQVFWSEVSDGSGPLQWYWQIFVREANKGVDPCEATSINNIYEFSAPGGKNFWNDAPTSISGKWDINVEGLDCVFFGDRLECPSANGMLMISCTADPRPLDDYSTLNMSSKAIVHCDW